MIPSTAPERPQNPEGQIRAAAPVIVVGVDGSPTSWDAFDWAAQEARRIGGRLVAVHVMSSADPAAAFGLSFDYPDVIEAQQALVGELKDEAERRGGRRGLPVGFVSECGDATHVLIEVARSAHADLVVVGRSTKALHRLAGSLSHRLTARGDAPVVVVVP